MRRHTSLRIFTAARAAVIPLFVLPVTIPAHAADASAWDKGMHSAVRLIAASTRRDGGDTRLRAGVEIRLDSGWKTYWRYPGDSGVPPRFTFTRSDNVKSVAIGWPAPHRFSDASGGSIGYKDHVIFPLTVEPQDATKPATLRLDLEYAICEKLCVPAEAKSELLIVGNTTSYDAALVAAEARVPRQRTLGENEPLSIRTIRRESPNRIVVDVTAPAEDDVDLFVEGPTPDWALPLPATIIDAPSDVRRFAFALDGLPPGAKVDGAVLTLTAVGNNSAIEVAYRLE